MNRDRNLIVEIMLKHARKESLTEEEAAALEAWRAESDDNRRLAGLYQDEEWVKAQLEERAAVPSAELWQMVCERTGMAAGQETQIGPTEVYRRRGLRNALSIAAVAALLLGIGVGLYRRMDHDPEGTVKEPAAEMATAAGPAAEATGGVGGVGGVSGHFERVQLLADGRRQIFDSAGWGVQPFAVRLPDGSTALLCDGSSLRYPAAFDSSHRVVDLDGQAFFTVMGNKGAPFVLRAGHTDIEVLGTRFNVNGYADDPVKTITLLKGKVRVLEDGHQQVLRPSEQAIVSKGRITVRTLADPDGVTGWANKEPYVEFDHEDINSTIRQLAQWYRITFVNPEHVSGVSFSGKLWLRDPLDSNLDIIGDIERPNVKIVRKGDSLFLLRGRRSSLSK